MKALLTILGKNQTGRHCCGILLFMVAMAFISSAQAALYKWVDADGNVTYSQIPPPSNTATVTTIKPPPPPSVEPSKAAERLQQQVKQLDKDNEVKNQAAKNAETEKKNKEIRKKNCDIARSNLAIIQGRGQKRIKDAQGNIKRLTAEEAATRITKAKKAIEENCKR